MSDSRIQQFELQLQHEIAMDHVEEIIRESPPALGEKIKWIRGYFEDEWRRSIVGRYQVAVLIRDIYDDVNENKSAVYGAKAVEAIKRAFGWDDGVIYHALHVADAFTPEQIEAIAQMRLPGGKPLSYSHVVALSGVEDEAQRQKLLNQTVREGWPTRKLANAIGLSETPQPAKPPDRRGRPLAIPRNFDAVLDQQGDFARDFLRRNTEVWNHRQHSLSAKVEELDTADFTQARADRLKKHADMMSLLAETAQQRANETLQVHKLFVEALRQQAEKHKKLDLSVTSSAADDPA